MKDVCSIGHITRDKIITPDNTVYMSGGTSFYMAHGMSALPHDVDFQLVTKVGKDQMEEVEKIRNKGIDTICFDSANTVFFENKYEEDSNKRTQRVLAKADPFTVEEMKNIDDAKVYHLGTLLADDFPTDVVKYLSSRGKVSIDVQGYLREVQGENVRAVNWNAKEDLLRFTNILKLNEHEMQVITNSHNPRTVAMQLHAMGVEEVIITLGSYGSIIYADNKFYNIPAYKPNRVVDVTGCGDTYSTGYLYMRAQGAGYEEAGKFAAAMCTLKLEHNGPFDGTIDDVMNICRRNEL